MGERGYISFYRPWALSEEKVEVNVAVLAPQALQLVTFKGMTFHKTTEGEDSAHFLRSTSQCAPEADLTKYVMH